MPTERLSMRKTREILRLKWHKGRSHRAVVTALNIGLGTVSEVVGRARRAGITSWQEVDALSEEELEARMYPSTATGAPRPLPSPAAIHIELRRKGVTLRLLHEEYFLSNPNG
jgi:transposase